MPNSVLDYAREKDSRFNSVSDEDLTLFLGQQHPEFLKDEDFKSEYQAFAAGKGTEVAMQGVDALMKSLTNPAAGEAAEEGREQAFEERKQAIIGSVDTATQGVSALASTLTSPAAGEAARMGREEPQLITDDRKFQQAIGQQDQPPQNALERAARNWEQAGAAAGTADVGPVEFGGTVIQKGPGVQVPTFHPPEEAGTIEKVAAGLWNIGASIPNFMLSPEGIATMIAPEVLPAKFAAPLLKGLFAGLMAKGTGEQLGEYSVTKDPQKLTEAIGGAVFTGMLGYEGTLETLDLYRAKKGMEPIKPPVRKLIQTLIDKVRPKTDEAAAPQTAQAVQEGSYALHRKAAEVLQSVQSQPGEGAGQVPTEGAGPEAGPRSEPAVSQKTQERIDDFKRFNELNAQLMALPPMERGGPAGLAIAREAEAIKNKVGGDIPQDPLKLAAELVPAVRTMEGKKIPATSEQMSHNDVIEGNGLETEDIDKRGFMDSKGNWYEREEAANKTGLSTEVEEGRLHSSDLPRAKMGLGATEGMGAAKYGEMDPTNVNPTSIKNSVVDQERAVRGLPPATEPARKAFGEVWDRAMQTIDNNAGFQDKLIEQLREKPRAVTDEEDAILLQRQIDLQNEYAKASRDLMKGVEDNNLEAVVREQLRTDRLADQLLELYDINKRVGTETGRGLNARKMMANEDFTLAKMVTDAKIARAGRVLSPEEQLAENVEIQKLHDKINQLQKDYDEAVKNADQKAAEAHSKKDHTERVKQVKDERAKKEKPPRDVNSATANLKKNDAKRREGGDASLSSNDIDELAKAFIEEGIDDREDLIDAVHEVLQGIDPDITRRQTMDAMSRYGQYRELSKDQIDVTYRELKGQMQQISKLQDMAAGHAPQRTGVEHPVPGDEQRRLIKQVEEAKKKGGYTVTDPARQLRTAMDAMKKRLWNQIIDLDHQIETRTKIVRNKTQVVPDAEILQLREWRDELKKDFDEIFKKDRTDAERIKAAITSLERQTFRYEQRIKAGDFIDKEKPSLAETPELTAAKAKRDAVKAQYEHLRDLDDEYATQKRAKELASRKKDLEEQVAELQRKMTEKDTGKKAREVDRPGHPELESLMQERDALKEQLRVKTKESVVRRLEAVNRQIAEKEAKLASGDVAPKPKAVMVDRPHPNPELESALQRLENVNQQIHDLRFPKRTAEQKALAAMKTRTANRIAELTDKIAKKDFTTKKRTPITLDSEATKLKAQLERLKLNWKEGLNFERMKNRGKVEKGADWITRLKRFQILSSPVSLAKLVSAAAERLAFTPMEEAAGAVIGKLIPSVAERAAREGSWSARAEGRAIASTVKEGMKDAWDILRTGRSDLDALYGHRQTEKSNWMDFWGRVHGTLKAAAKRAEFARSYTKRMENAAAHNVDVTDELVKLKIGIEAYKDANRSIFLQDNFVTDAYQAAIGRLQQKDITTGKPTLRGKATATALRILMPIVKVPTNIVGETLQYVTGSVTGSAKLADAFYRGVENLKPEEADIIMRSLKKGSIGLATMALGFFNPDIFGGYYQSGEKRRKDEAKAGGIRVGVELPIFGHNVPAFVLHNPLLETLQIGATVRRVMDSHISKKNWEHKGAWEGIYAAGLGLGEQVPFIRETFELGKAFNLRQKGAFWGELAKSQLIPQALQWAAQQSDKDDAGEVIKRRPTTVLQHLEMGIPVLRQDVPKAKQ